MAEGIRFYVDEDTVHLGKALAAVRDDVVHPGHVRCPISRGELDLKWLPVVGAAGWLLISRDKRLRTKPVEKVKLIDAGIRAVILTSGGNMNRWSQLQLVVRFWDQIDELTARPGPFVHALTAHGVSALPLRDPRSASGGVPLP
jgi:hypothetical protein